ncbi:MAG: P-II family nitrogen regulator [Candidatus Omnitrophica bacterium]|nr:P-II family nitrogen regulator [Candidatus Omnitrophota bacterium]MDD5573588.1 P-II family nitrogen regulator [Candidatus Omnitrophota bacterium]
MKKIEAVIRVEKLEDVVEALKSAGAPGLMVMRIEGHGRQKGLMEQFRGREYKVDLLPKIKIETVVSDGDAVRFVEVIARAAQTGEIGDGKIFVSPVSDVMRIRTKETGEGAI